MKRTLFAALAAAVLVIGCVSVGPPESTSPSISPSSGPTLGVTTPAPPTTKPTQVPTPPAAPTATPTSAPTPTAEITPTPSPTTEPSETATSAPSTEPGSPPTRDLLFTDEMTDSTSGWDEFSEDFASVAYDSGVLAMRFDSSGAWAYTAREIDTPTAVLRPVAQFEPASAGVFGLLCGNVGIYYGAVVGTDGSIIFLSIDSNGVNVLQRDDAAGLDIPVGEATALGIQCTADGSGLLRIELVLAGSGPVAVYEQAADGPANFDAVAIYGEASSDGFTLAVDTAAAYAVGGEDAVWSAGAQAVLPHIPTDFQTGCAESPIPPLFAEQASYVMLCMLRTSGDGAELAEYIQFDSKDLMDAAYQVRVDAFGVDSQGSCETGPNETSWSISGTAYGRVQCAPQAIGVRFDWTDDRVNILSTLVDLDGDYTATYNQWVNAGPLE